MALVLPRLLAPVLPTTYSPSYLHLAKAQVILEHLGFPYHTFVHCKGFAPAAPRRAGTSISVSLSGLPLSRPVRIISLVGHYPTNNLIRRCLIFRHRSFVGEIVSRTTPIFDITLSFPRLSRTQRQINNVLLSISPVVPKNPLDLHGLIEPQ